MPADLFARLDLDQIYPGFLELALELIARCEKRGVIYFATSGFRSPAEQMALWQKGRNSLGAVVAPAAVVTRKKFGHHNIGTAIDFTRDISPDRSGLQPSWQPEDYAVLVEEATALGLEAGGAWVGFPDWPHIQLPLNSKGVTVNQCKHIYDVALKAGATPEAALKKVWEFLDRKGPWVAAAPKSP